MKKYTAEALGTGALTLVVALSLSSGFPVPTPILAGLVLGLFVYSVGSISGTHINPAVTVGVWSLNKISNRDALFYIIAQTVGAGVAMFFVSNTVGLASLVVTASSMVLLAEILGTFFFTFGIASVVFGKVSSQMSGLVIGGSLLLGIEIAATLGSNGVLNPAVAFGIGSFNLFYVLGPILGSYLGMQAYRYISKEN